MKGSAVPSQLAPVPLRGRQDSAQEGDPRAARAWLREMERAQMEAWLCHAVVGCPQRTHPSGSVPAPDRADTTLAATESARAGSQVKQRAINAEPSIATVGTASTLRTATASDAVAAHHPGPTVSSPSDHPTSRPTFVTASVESIPAPGLVSDGQQPLRAREWSQPHGEPWPMNAAKTNAQLVVAVNEFGSFAVTASFDGPACPPESDSAGLVSTLTVSQVNTAGARPQDATHFMLEQAVHADHVALIPVLPPGYAAAPMQVAPFASTNLFPGPLRPLRPAAPSEAQHVRPPVATDPGAGDPDPIRLHAHWSAEGVRVWLGMDSSVMSGLQSISAQLHRWLSAQGLRLLSISCNGRVIADAQESVEFDTCETTPPAQPAPSPRNRTTSKEIS